MVDRQLQNWRFFLLGDYSSVVPLIIVGLARGIAVNGCLLEKIKNKKNKKKVIKGITGSRSGRHLDLRNNGVDIQDL